MADIVVYLGVSGLVKHLVCYWWWDRIPREAVLAGRVTKLNVYPVKSMREVEVPSLQCSQNLGPHSGQLIDRQFMVISKDLQNPLLQNPLLSIRNEPKLILVQPQLDGNTLTLAAPGHSDVMVDINDVIKANKIVKTILHTIPVVALDCGDAVSTWLCRYLGRDDVTLLYSTPTTSRRDYQFIYNPLYGRWTRHANPEDKLFFQDISPFHVLSEESVTSLSEKLGWEISPLQFRPNITVSLDKGAHDEDTWSEVFIGTARFKLIKWMDRCVLPTIDRETGVRNSQNEPLKTLKSYRVLVPDKGPMFGVDLIVLKPGTIRVGDPIYVIRGFDMNAVSDINPVDGTELLKYLRDHS